MVCLWYTIFTIEVASTCISQVHFLYTMDILRCVRNENSVKKVSAQNSMIPAQVPKELELDPIQISIMVFSKRNRKHVLRVSIELYKHS